MIDVEWLMAHLAFSEELSFTRAARARHVSQPALHAQVKKLEASLGVSLYRRRGRALELTDAGRRTAAFAREMRDRIGEFEGELHAPRAEAPAVLAAGEGAYLHLLGGALRAFTGDGTGSLRLLTRDAAGGVDAVASGEAHLAVVSVDAPPEGLVSEALTEVPQALVVPTSHALAKKKRVKVRELDGVRMVVPPVGRPHRTMLSQAFAASGVTLSVGVEASGWALMMHFVELGIGAAIVNACCDPPAGLVAIRMPELPARTYQLLRRAATPLRGSVGRLRDAIVAHAGDWQAAGHG